MRSIWSVGSAVLFSIAIASSAEAVDLSGEWQVAGTRGGASYQGSVKVTRQGGTLRLTWTVVQNGRSEVRSGSFSADRQSFSLYSRLGFGQRLRSLFRRRTKLAYRGTVDASGPAVQVSLTTAKGAAAGQETWTRVVAPPGPDPVPAPHELPFVHPDRYEPQPSTDVWEVQFTPSKFREDMRRNGLWSGDAATDQAMTLRLKSLILQSVNEKYGRNRRGEAVPGRSWKISFTAAPPKADPRVFPGVASPRVGVHYSRMEVGGRDGGTHGRVPRNDHGNRRKEDNTGSRWGVFAGSILGVDSRLNPPLTASDRPYVDGSYSLGDGSAAQDQRFLRVQEVSADWAYALSSTLAHEVGHSVGCPHTGKTVWGRVVRAGPRLSLMRHKKDRSILSSHDTRFYSGNQRRLDSALGRD